MNIKEGLICLMFGIALLLCSCQSNGNLSISIPDVTGNFDFTILKAGQADAIILKTENYTMLIDCGEKDDGNVVLEYIPGGSFKAVLIASPQIKTGEKYSITIGDETFETEIKQQNTVIGTQTSGGFGAGRGLTSL